jgi:P pilus assembly chaperone PapD
MRRLPPRIAMRTAGVAWCALGRLASAQLPGVAVDPHLVVLTHAKPSGEIVVVNPRSRATDFSVDLHFGYATTDSAGQARVTLTDGVDSASAAEWITPSPRRFRLAPGASQTVRLLARAPADTRDGEYWARLTVHARDAIPPSRVAEGVADAAPAMGTAPHIALSLETATVLPVFYRQGVMQTGVVVESIEARAVSDSALEVRAALRRTGNAAFVGLATITVRDALDRIVAATTRQVAVYRAAAPRWRLPFPGSDRGVGYRVTVELSTRRHDVDPHLVVQSDAQEHTIAVIPE